MKAVNNKRLMCIVAHPDDESLGMGGTLAKYASEGVQTYLLMATKGERGRFGTASVSPGMAVVGQARARELEEAASILGISEVSFLGYIDGVLDKALPAEAIARISRNIRRVRPQVVLTFGPEGAYGHPDHIAISQFTTAAIVQAANPYHETRGLQPHSVSKLYYMAWPPAKWDVFQSAFKELVSKVDGVRRQATPYPDWAITTRIDTSAYWQTAWKAIRRHKTQMAIYGQLEQLSEAQHLTLWGSQEFYRAFSLVNGGRQTESCLFEGINENGQSIDHEHDNQNTIRQVWEN
ncbi:MAG: PIG-L family deacetylase [Phaeodactylibacter sp.]|nr:PIG-L family deacetylase [Phaeodactylibacter sp.]MCB9277087.1 PIG-L family deacetylase [Lewinellaceae bacterium]